MKKFFLLVMTAATMLFASSCSKEQISSNAPVGEQVTVTLTADLGAIESRAISDGLSVNEVAWAIYLHGADKPLPELYGVLPISNKQGTLEVRLVTGKSYDIALFAYYKDGATTEQALGAAAPKFYNVDWDSKTIALNYPSPLANDTDERDCFWYVKQNLAVDGPVNETFILTRPLAQLNFGVTKEDTTAAAEAGLVVSQSKIVASTYESFNMFTGECLGQLKEYTFAQNAVPQQELEVENIAYTYVGTAYLLVDEKETQEVSLTIYNNDANNTQINTLNYSYVPFQRNYRTNILGALLTNPIEFNIVVDERFNEPDFIVKHWDGTTKAVAEVNGTYTVTEPAELAWVAQQVNSGENNFEGKSVVLQGEVIDLNSQNNQLWTPIGVSGKPFKGSFDGNGVVIRNMKVSALECAGLFGNVLSSEGIKNVVLEDVVIESSHYAGAVVGYAYSDVINCSVDGLTLTVTPNDTTRAAYDNGDKVGGIAGYVAEKSGTAGYKINNNTVKNAVITAYRDLGGVAGAAYIAECVGNKVENSVLTVDQTVNNYGEKDANLGEFVGRVLSGVVGDDNVATDVELVYKPEELGYPTIEDVINNENSGPFTIKGWVVATSDMGIIIKDKTGIIYAYNPSAKPAVGTMVIVKGSTSEHGGVKQIAAKAQVTALDQTVEVEHPTSEVWTAEQIDAYCENPTRTYVNVKGTLVRNGKYYNIVVDGANVQGSIANPTKELQETLNNLHRAVVTVSGYAMYTSTSGGVKFMNIITTAVKDHRKATEWGVVGDLTGWAEGKDIPMYTYDDNLMFALDVEISNGSFKIRANNKWDDAKNYGMKGGAQTVYTDMKLELETSGGSGNITPAESGTYDIYFDLNKKLGYVMTVGKSISEAAEFKAYVKPKNKYSWAVIGSFSNDWKHEYSTPMTIEGDYAVAKGVTLANGDEFKFAADKSWTLSYGSGCDVNVDKKYTTYNNGGNMKFVGDAGAYNIYFSMVEGDDSFYMEKYVEAEPKYVKVTSAPTDTDWTGKYLIVMNDNKIHSKLSGKDLIAEYTGTITEDEVNAADVDAYAMTITKSTTDGKYYMTYPDGKYFGITAKNTSNALANPFDLTIKYTSKGVEIISTLSGTDYILYSNNKQYFRCYVSKAGNNTYALPTLYKYTE
ncbi:MAG: hypothetical protein IJZ67_06065 [Alistipes sp.]|nr:hypothetical protein [Alistipes sp.]